VKKATKRRITELRRAIARGEEINASREEMAAVSGVTPEQWDRMLGRGAVSVGDRVEVLISIVSKEGIVMRHAFGKIIALDQVAVVVEGEVDARAFEPRKVRVL
jgi:hypothetical protein